MRNLCALETQIHYGSNYLVDLLVCHLAAIFRFYGENSHTPCFFVVFIDGS